MLHPNQSQVNEAWIAFKLNDAPIRTESDRDVNCVALVDAASCFIVLSTTFVSANEIELSKVEVPTVAAVGTGAQKIGAQGALHP
jgi:hypothetical protein